MFYLYYVSVVLIILVVILNKKTTKKEQQPETVVLRQPPAQCWAIQHCATPNNHRIYDSMGSEGFSSWVYSQLENSIPLAVRLQQEKIASEGKLAILHEHGMFMITTMATQEKGSREGFVKGYYKGFNKEEAIRLYKEQYRTYHWNNENCPM